MIGHGTMTGTESASIAAYAGGAQPSLQHTRVVSEVQPTIHVQNQLPKTEPSVLSGEQSQPRTSAEPGSDSMR